MLRKVPLIVLLLLLAAGPVHGGSVPVFTFTDLNGKTYTSDNLKGTPLVVNIGSHW